VIRVLAGGPSRCTGEAHEVAWRACIERQSAWGVEVVFRAIDAADDLANDYEVGEVAHGWSSSAIGRVARARQRFLDDAKTEGFHAVWMVDDDVLCGPDVLVGLLGAADIGPRTPGREPVAVGVYYTPGWLPDDPARELPQVWDRHPFSVDPATVEMWRQPVIRRVAGGGACTLIPAQHGAATYWPPLAGVEHWGEDRWACLRWAARDVPVYAVGGLPIVHAYQRAQRESGAVAEAMRRLWGEL
jgi:hypothetical protein